MSAPEKEDQGYQVEPEPTSATTEVPTSPSSAVASSASPPLSPPPANPKLAQLRSLFPETSDDILSAVLDAHGGDLQASTESLLDLNNPEFKTDPAHQEEMEQIDLDAELARQLAEEDELRYRQQQQEQQQRRQVQTPREQQPIQPVTYQAYVPKRRRATGDTTQQQEGHGSWAPPSESSTSQTGQRGQQKYAREEEEKDELDVLAENFSKLAEQGKKTFGSWMGKMKEQVGKLDDMIQQSASPSTSSDRPPPPPPKPSFGSARTGAQWTAPEPLPRPENAPPRTSSTTNPRDTLARHDTNDSFTIGDDTDHSPNPSPSTGQSQPPPGESIDSYFKDFDSRAPPEPPIKVSRNDPAAPADGASTPADTKEPEEKAVTTEEAKSSSLAPPPKDPRKDFSKIGLLPRRSVSLLDDDKLHRSSTSTERIKSPLAHPSETTKQEAIQTERANDSDDDDELEYVKNPFDEE